MRALISAALLATLVASGCAKNEAAPPAPPPPPQVTVVCPVQQTVVEHEEFSGRTWSPNTVEIRARVSGYLEEVPFKDGDTVKEGDVLFDIDDDTYAAELERAEAAIQQAKATHERLKGQLARVKRLANTRTATAEELETLTFQTAEAEAAKNAAIAARDLARLNVAFTKIKSPITGRIGRRLVDPGNLVEADETSLAHVVSLDPLHAYFDFDERTIIRLRKLKGEGKMLGIPVKLALAGESEFPLQGEIDWMDNQVDPGTGTLRARVSIPNKDLLLSPGMFVRLRVPVGVEEPSLMIPEEALGSDQGQRFVYVVNDKDEIEYRSVQIGWLAGKMRVIRSGLSIEDRVVVAGLQRVRPRTKVTVKEDSLKGTDGEESQTAQK